VRAAVLMIVSLAGLVLLSGCTSNDPALAAKAQSAISAAGNAKYVESVTATSDGKATVILSETAAMGNTSWVQGAVVPMISVEVLQKVPEVKELTIAWDATHPIGVWKQK
jgi:hypothetical protein